MVLHRGEKEVEKGVNAVGTDLELKVIPLDSVALDVRRREALVEALKDAKDIIASEDSEQTRWRICSIATTSAG